VLPNFNSQQIIFFGILFLRRYFLALSPHATETLRHYVALDAARRFVTEGARPSASGFFFVFIMVVR